MNFLQLAQDLRQEAGVPGSGPTAVTAQVGEAARLVSYIASAWTEIQGTRNDWTFMRDEFSFETSADVGEYTPDDVGITSFSKWWPDTLRCYLSATSVSDEQHLRRWDYHVFRDTYRFGSQIAGRPACFAVRPSTDALLIGPVPTELYTITGEYQRSPTVLAAGTDTPDIATHLHKIIVYKAMQFYGLYESAPEVLARGERGFMALEAEFNTRYLPTLQMGDPLA